MKVERHVCTDYYSLSQSKLSELISLLSAENLEYKFSPTAYKRFLAACNEDIRQALAAMIKHNEWRNLIDIDSVCLENSPSFSSKNIVLFGPRDWDGRPTLCNIIRRHDKNDRNMAEFENYIAYYMEKALKLTNPEEEKLIIIMDLHDFGFINMDYELVKSMIHILQVHYQECLYKIIIVNSPWIFMACWVIIKPWIDVRTASKVEFIDIQKLNDYLDTSKLPSDVYIEN